MKSGELQTGSFGPHPDDAPGRQVPAARQLLRPALHLGQVFGFVCVRRRHIDQERVLDMVVKRDVSAHLYERLGAAGVSYLQPADTLGT